MATENAPPNTSELSELLGTELEALAQAPSETTFHRAVGNVIDHMVAQELPAERLTGLYENLKSVLISTLEGVT